MTGCPEVLLLVLCLLAQPTPAQNPPTEGAEAARDLARKVAAVISREPAGFSVGNQSTLPAPEFEDARRALEAEFHALGVRTVAAGGAAEIRVTASENLARWLLVAEVRRGEQRFVLISEWPRRTGAARTAAPALRLEKRLVFEQDVPILDFALLEKSSDSYLLLLDTTRVALFARSAAGWEARQSWPVALPAPWPRDPRGRLFLQGSSFQAYLPGGACRGTLDPPAMDCKSGETLWLLTSGATPAGYASFSPGRNYFEGALTTASGARGTVPPFYAAALAGAGPEPLWLFSTTEGRVAVYSPALAATGRVIPGWGGDIAGVQLPCAGGRQVLATRPGAGEADAIRAWQVTAEDAVPVSPPLDFAGPVTALWPSGADSAAAVTRDPATGNYAAYHVAIGCGS